MGRNDHLIKRLPPNPQFFVEAQTSTLVPILSLDIYSNLLKSRRLCLNPILEVQKTYDFELFFLALE